MARCFLTGVEFYVKDGYVLNRGDAYRLLRMLKRRVENLEGLIAQLSPYDKPNASNTATRKHRKHRLHRMVCKGVADALVHAYPETELLISWPALLDRDIKQRMLLLKDHQLYGASIAGLTGEELSTVAKLGRSVLQLIDPHYKLPYDIRLAISAGICVRHQAKRANEIVALIHSMILGNEGMTELGLPEEAHDPVRSALMRIQPPPRR
jgi:hypothetical protein